MKTWVLFIGLLVIVLSIGSCKTCSAFEETRYIRMSNTMRYALSTEETIEAVTMRLVKKGVKIAEGDQHLSCNEGVSGGASGSYFQPRVTLVVKLVPDVDEFIEQPQKAPTLPFNTPAK